MVVTAAVMLIPETMTAIVVGLVGTAAVILGTVRAMGALPADVDDHRHLDVKSGPGFRA